MATQDNFWFLPSGPHGIPVTKHQCTGKIVLIYLLSKVYEQFCSVITKRKHQLSPQRHTETVILLL